jgi:hypothetical protein
VSSDVIDGRLERECGRADFATDLAATRCGVVGQLLLSARDTRQHHGDAGCRGYRICRALYNAEQGACLRQWRHIRYDEWDATIVRASQASASARKKARSSPEISSPESTSPPLSFSSTEDRASSVGLAVRAFAALRANRDPSPSRTTIAPWQCPPPHPWPVRQRARWDHRSRRA